MQSRASVTRTRRPAVFVVERNALALALALAGSDASGASAHCYSVWRYPHAQAGCRALPVLRRSGARLDEAQSFVRSPVPAPLKPSPGPAFDIPLSDPDPLTTALRAKLLSGGL